ncbi:MAG: hypothetical protein JEZ00_08030 [Anaerolineaceae bacterium]|nr:hypothetical protein [Anaerolineaceae bacterium]
MDIWTLENLSSVFSFSRFNEVPVNDGSMIAGFVFYMFRGADAATRMIFDAIIFYAEYVSLLWHDVQL